MIRTKKRGDGLGTHLLAALDLRTRNRKGPAMDDATSQARTCEICGHPLRRDNKSGICGRKNSPACMTERSRRSHATGPLTDRRYCEVCGGVLKAVNVTGLCMRTRACIEERAARKRKARPGPKPCAHPDGCPSDAKVHGYCGMHWQRLRDTGDLGPAGSKMHPIIVRKDDVFGKWTALEDYDRTDAKVLCRCECGRTKRVRAKSLVDGTSKSCQCRSGPRERRTVPIVRPGEVYNRLTVLEAGYLYDDLIRVRCGDCGDEVEKMAGMVRDGRVKTCGCGRGSGKRTHGLYRHPLYGTWRGIVSRCTDPNSHGWQAYGGNPVRPITMCEGYLGAPDGLLRFAADLGPRPGPQYTVDRRDNDLGYFCGQCAECVRRGHPANCRWATKREQSLNQRKVPVLTMQNADLAARLKEAERLLIPAPSRKRSVAPAAQGVLF